MNKFRVELNKLKVNGAECIFDKAELIIDHEETHLGNDMYVDDLFKWNIEVKNGKSHANFKKMYFVMGMVNLYFETVDGHIVNGKGHIGSLLIHGGKYEEIDIAVKEWAVMV